MTSSSNSSSRAATSPALSDEAYILRSRLRPLALGLAGTIVLAAGALLGSGCGSTTTSTVERGASAATTLAVTSPSRGSVLSSDQVTVRGTVTPADAAVEVQGQPAAVGNGVFTGTATVHGGKTTIDVIASAPDTAPASTSVVVTRPAKSAVARASGSSGQSTPGVAYSGGYSGQTSCGGGLSVGPNTTCAFAEDVRSSYDESGPGTVTAYSPVTNRTYAMNCSGGVSVVCTGGIGASVYFTDGVDRYGNSSPGYAEPTPNVAHDGAHSGQTSCGGGLSVGPNTTCAFAEDVRSSYDDNGPGTVMAYSPVTNRSYAMTCTNAGSVVCTGANHASVYFP
jgi:hypothetical protein